jgi:hypothetical protein
MLSKKVFIVLFIHLFFIGNISMQGDLRRSLPANIIHWF